MRLLQMALPYMADGNLHTHRDSKSFFVTHNKPPQGKKWKWTTNEQITLAYFMYKECCYELMIYRLLHISVDIYIFLRPPNV